MRTYESPSRDDGVQYTIELPDGWITQKEDDGDHWYIAHRSPKGSRLILAVVTKVSTNWQAKGMPPGLVDEPLRMAYTLADSDSCQLPARSMTYWFARYLAHGLGWHERLEEETLGATRGFSYKVGYRGKLGWYGWYSQAPCMVRVDFQPAGSEPEAEIADARHILASLKIGRVSQST